MDFPTRRGNLFQRGASTKVRSKRLAIDHVDASIAVQETLLQTCELQTDIKWPNDILHDDKKLCGILAETVETNRGRAVIVGIGINLTNAALPPELETVAISVEAAILRAPDMELLNCNSPALFHDALSRFEIIRTIGSCA
jgi:biotin-(acetyl-CoA carboxylase) ligase